jgi:hypothetical protein
MIGGSRNMNGTIKPNAIKIEFTQEEFRIFFAVIDGENNATEEVQVAIAPNNVLSVVAPMVNAVVDYQKQFNIDLGIKTPER